jgi:GDPmannose 4,6-dehydratase
MKKALITGITGQDGSYLAELLIKKGYQVHGIKRRSSSFNTGRIDHIYTDRHIEKRKLHLHFGDLTDSSSLISIIKKIEPDEIYNLGAQSHVAVSFETPEYTANSDALGTLRILEAIKILGFEKKTKFYQASTSELFGDTTGYKEQDEATPFKPRSPYAAAKLYSYWIVRNYRESYNIFAANGILFNHESERRGETFVTRKISLGVSKIKLGMLDHIYLGNINTNRDWGHAKDYVYAMWLMMQYDKPLDLVFATGITRSVKEFVNESFAVLNIEIEWRKGNDGFERAYALKGLDSSKRNSDLVVDIDPILFRPSEVDHLKGNSNKAKDILGWNPTINFPNLVKAMVLSDYNKLSNNI